MKRSIFSCLEGTGGGHGRDFVVWFCTRLFRDVFALFASIKWCYDTCRSRSDLCFIQH